MDQKLNSNLRLGFFGGVGSVTGANFLLENSRTKILVDCGLIQGYFKDTDPNFEKFPYNPKEIDYLKQQISDLRNIVELLKEKN